MDRATRVLGLSFDDGARFSLPCEHRRVLSPAAETKVVSGSGEWIVGKHDVSIESITLVVNYAVQISFDDVHDTGIYSWQTLYEPGHDREKKWRHCPGPEV